MVIHVWGLGLRFSFREWCKPVRPWRVMAVTASLSVVTSATLGVMVMVMQFEEPKPVLVPAALRSEKVGPTVVPG
jgi:hypothetical protein